MTPHPTDGVTSAALDHVVINAMRELDGVAACFTDLGFQLTPLGRHSLGSINHLMMTPGPYLELVGVPPTGLQRPDVLASPLGLNGLVLGSGDAEATLARLTRAGRTDATLLSFSRPVAIDGSTHDARFRTVRFPTEAFAAGRVYLCEHLTPDLVWRDEWLRHPNGFCGIDSMVVEGPDPAADLRAYAEVCGVDAKATPDGGHIALGAFQLGCRRGKTARFASLGLRFDRLDDLDRRARIRAEAASDVVWERMAAGEASLDVPSLGLRMVCRSR